MACRICRRPNHNARSCKRKSRNKLGRRNPVWEKTKKAVGAGVKMAGKLLPGNVDPRAIRMFGSWALDYVIPREVRANFLRELDTNLSMGRKECLANLGEDHCQKIEMVATSLGKTWAKTTRKVEAALGRDGQFDAYLDVFNDELQAAVQKSDKTHRRHYRYNPAVDDRKLTGFCECDWQYFYI